MANPIKDSVWTDKKRTIFGLPLSFTRYILTPTKFIVRKGFFNIEEEEIDLYKITDKKLKFSFWQRIFGCGKMVLYSRDVDTPELEVGAIKIPREVSELLDVYITEHRDKYNIRGKEFMSPVHPDAPGGMDDFFE